MKLKLEELDDLASTLYAFEDPDSEVPYLEEGSEQFKQELKAYQQTYETLGKRRKIGLRLAVSWFLSHKIKKADKNLEEKLKPMVPDFYKRIWVQLDTEEEEKLTEEITKELDIPRYIAAMKYILNHINQQSPN